MPNVIEFAPIFQRQLDALAVQECTSGWMEPNQSLIIYNGGADVKIPILEMDGLADYDRNEGFVTGSVSLHYETMTMKHDRGTQFIIDAMTVNESGFLATASAIMGQFQREKVVPEIDACRYSTIAQRAMELDRVRYGYIPAAATILKELDADIETVREEVSEETPLTITMSFATAGILSQNDKTKRIVDVSNFTKGDLTYKVKSLDGDIPIIRVSSKRLKTAYKFWSARGEEKDKFGFEPLEDALDINWIISARRAPIAVSRTDNTRIFDPQTYQKANAWAADYRRYHDIWVPKNRMGGIMVNIKQAKPAAPTTPSSGEK